MKTKYTRNSPEVAIKTAPDSPANYNAVSASIEARLRKDPADRAALRERLAHTMNQRAYDRLSAGLELPHSTFFLQGDEVWIWVKIDTKDFAAGMRTIKTYRRRRYDSRTRLWAVPYLEFKMREKNVAIWEPFTDMVYHDHDCEAHRARRVGTCTKGCLKHWK